MAIDSISIASFTITDLTQLISGTPGTIVRVFVAVCYSALQSIAVCCSAVQHDAEWCRAVQCGAVRCSAVQCGAVRYRLLHCVAVCCRVLLCVAVRYSLVECGSVCCRVLQFNITNLTQFISGIPGTIVREFVAICCSAMQCAAAWFSALRWGTVCCSMLQRGAVCCRASFIIKDVVQLISGTPVREWSQTNFVELWLVSRPRSGRHGHRDMGDMSTNGKVNRNLLGSMKSPGSNLCADTRRYTYLRASL